MWGVRVSQKIHDHILNKVSRAVISFFDKTPIGRILTRLSEDMTIIDFLLQVLYDNNLLKLHADLLLSMLVLIRISI